MVGTLSSEHLCGKQGFGWAIAKALGEAGAEIALGVWVRRVSLSIAVHLATRWRTCMPTIAGDAGSGPEHLREQPAKREVRRLPQAVGRLAAGVLAHISHGCRLRQP